MNIEEMDKNAEQAIGLLKAMANRNRLLILCHLVAGEKPVGELADLVRLSHAATSQQLALLRKDGLVKGRRAAQTVYYSLASDNAEHVVVALHDAFCGPEETRGRRHRRRH